MMQPQIHCLHWPNVDRLIVNAHKETCEHLGLTVNYTEQEIPHGIWMAMLGVMKEANVDVVTCPRNLYREDGSWMCVDEESDGYNFNDTNCYLFGPTTHHLARNWMFKSRADCAVGDRHMWANVKAHHVRIARSLKPTVNYSTRVVEHYKAIGEVPPVDSQMIMMTDKTVEIYKLARMIYK